jgi:hypothetical protein
VGAGERQTRGRRRRSVATWPLAIVLAVALFAMHAADYVPITDVSHSGIAASSVRLVSDGHSDSSDDEPPGCGCVSACADMSSCQAINDGMHDAARPAVQRSDVRADDALLSPNQLPVVRAAPAPLFGSSVTAVAVARI